MANTWQVMTLEEAIQINPQRALPKGVNAPFIAMEEVIPSQRLIEVKQTREYKGSGARFTNGDTLFARITPCLENGKTAFISGLPQDIVGHGSTEFIVMSGKEGLSDSLFVYYLARDPNFRAYSIQRMEGTSGRQRVPVSALSKLIIELPPLPEQHAITHILGMLDDKIELNRQMNQTLVAMVQALFKNWFVDFEPFQSQGMQSSPLGEIPVGWKIEPLGDHFEVVRGLSYKGEYLSNDGIPLHNLNSVYEGGGYKYEGIKFYQGEYQDKHTVVAGDIIVTNTEQGFDFLLIGYPAIIPRCFGLSGLFSHHLFRLRVLASSPLTPPFIYLLLRNRVYHEIVAGYTNGTTVNMLQQGDLNRLPIVVPPRETSARFDSLVAPLLIKTEQIHDESDLLSALRDTLLPKLLSGEIRVKYAEKFVEKVS